MQLSPSFSDLVKAYLPTLPIYTLRSQTDMSLDRMGDGFDIAYLCIRRLGRYDVSFLELFLILILREHVSLSLAPACICAWALCLHLSLGVLACTHMAVCLPQHDACTFCTLVLMTSSVKAQLLSDLAWLRPWAVPSNKYLGLAYIHFGGGGAQRHGSTAHVLTVLVCHSGLGSVIRCGYRSGVGR